ncbi:MAG: type IV secretion system protein VirB10 [Pseudomonadota bacterium]
MSTELPDDASQRPGLEHHDIPGERGIASVNSVRTLQSRLTTWAGIGLMGALGAGLLTWYYSNALAHQNAPRDQAQQGLDRRVRGEMTLPPLRPRVWDPPATPPSPSLVSQMLGPRPQLPEHPRSVAVGQPRSASDPSAKATERLLKGAVFASLSEHAGGGARASSSDVGATNPLEMSDRAGANGNSEGDLASLLTARAVSAVKAQVLPSQRLLLPKGAFLDCTLETAIDSTLPGMTTCVTATDTYGADGTVVLLERGSKLVGETRGNVRAGGSRLFVLWTEARTPTGVVIPLASPGTDELGRAGMAGEVERHFWERFGAAMLVSVVDGAVQAATRSEGGSAVIISPSAGRDVMTEILRDTIRIPPTLRKPQGDRIQVLVARDLDFRSVYLLTRAALTAEDSP